MTKTAKTMAVTAIILISCMASICVLPAGDATSKSQDYEDIQYWGIGESIDSIDEVLPYIREIMPGAPEIKSIDDLESLMKTMAISRGFNENDVALDFDMTASGQILGNKDDANTFNLEGGATALIYLDIRIPMEFIRMLVQGDGYVPTESTDVMMLDVRIEIDRHSESQFHLNEDKEISYYESVNERMIHILGYTNIGVVNGKVTYLPDATNKVDHTMINVLHTDAHFISDGFKFMPTDENDNGWSIDVDAQITKLGTVHNITSGVSGKILDLISDNLSKHIKSAIINPDTHSGVALHRLDIKNYDVTATVDRSDGVPLVKFTDNAPEEKHGFLFRFMEPLKFIFYDLPLENAYKIFNENMILDEDTAKAFQNKNKDSIANCETHTKNAEINVIFLADDKDIFEQTPLAYKIVKYGESVVIDIEAPEREGLTHIGWMGIGSKSVLMGTTPPLHCDIFIIPAYVKVITSAPTAQDFEDSDVPLAWVHDMDDDNIRVDGDLIKEHRTHMYVIGQIDGKSQYMWKVSGYGAEDAIGDIDLTLRVGIAPEYALEKIDGKEFIYLSANLGDNVPISTSLHYKIEDKFDDVPHVDVYVDNGTGLEFAGAHHIENGSVMIHGEKAKGFLVVGGDVKPVPEPNGDGSGNNNIILIPCIVITMIIIVAIAVFMMRKNN